MCFELSEAEERALRQVVEPGRTRHIDRRSWSPPRPCASDETGTCQDKVADGEEPLDELPRRTADALRHSVLTEQGVRKVLDVAHRVLTGAWRNQVLAAVEADALDQDLGVRVLLLQDFVAPDVVTLEQGPDSAGTERLLRVVWHCHPERGEPVQPHQSRGVAREQHEPRRGSRNRGSAGVPRSLDDHGSNHGANAVIRHRQITASERQRGRSGSRLKAHPPRRPATCWPAAAGADPQR